MGRLFSPPDPPELPKIEEPDPLEGMDDTLNREARRRRTLADRRQGVDALRLPLDGPAFNIPEI
jgi:hypothetical protein